MRPNHRMQQHMKAVPLRARTRTRVIRWNRTEPRAKENAEARRNEGRYPNAGACCSSKQSNHRSTLQNTAATCSDMQQHAPQQNAAQRTSPVFKVNAGAMELDGPPWPLTEAYAREEPVTHPTR